MESIATVLYARLRNVLAICNAMTQQRSVEFVAELRNVLEGPIARQNGVVAMARPDSILAVFSNEADVAPDHARRSLHAALLCVYGAMELSKQMAMRDDGANLPPLSLAVGAHLGKVEVSMGRQGSTSGLIRATGEAVEIARALESAAPDLRWSIVASGATRRAAGARIESGRIGSIGLPDGGFIDVTEITGLAPTRSSRTPPEVYQAVRDAVALNQRLYDRPQDILAAARGSPSTAPMQLTIEGYRVVRKIGEGGMAKIYLVTTDKSDEMQVLKVMRMGNSEQGDVLQRFMQEFALLAQVQHPNIAKIYRQDFVAGHAYIAMEYFSHGDLRARIAERVSPEDAMSYVKQTAAALGAIHAAGIVHRDLKPDNLMLRRDGSIALADFGVAKHVSILITETAHDEVVGTPYYLSPEQATAQPVDQRCDLYSLGVVMYELLTGAKPYRARTAEELLDLHVNGPIPELPAEYAHLQPLLEGLMAKDREQRYPSAGAFLEDLARLGC
jgi:serine/threonine-protein kinase PpkA